MNTSTSQNSISRATQIKECENQAKFVQQRVNEIESFFGDLCAELVSYTRRTAKLRNNGDEIARILLDYSVKEKINRSSASTLKKVSEYLATLEDYRHTEVDRLVGKVVNPLASYGNEIKTVRANLKTEQAARKREIASRKKLERSSTAEQSRLAEIQLHNSIIDANKRADKLERCVVEFEARRLKGLKTILKDFVQIEMIWHAKALETLSETYNTLQSLHEEADLLDFRATLMRSGSSVFSVISDGHLARPLGPGVQNASLRQTDNHIHSSRSSIPTGQTNQQPSGDRPKMIQKAGRQVEDVTSLFSDEEEEDEDDEDEDEDEDDSEVLRTTSAVRSNRRGDDLEDLEDDNDSDEDASEMTQTGPTTSTNSRRLSMQPTKLITQSPLKSALKSSGTKQVTLA
ncbi:hypothetical protein PHET_03522 [Paragonimus heterotremus]|uniref:Protein FAM92A1 n=1 Tax=Paragonimus heterotremus TaxID=100268 RepID=A0A8J4TJX0_9TREM|nr:hypothetical protein PHET_03522 [Paragonimus heterotremus]